MKNGAHFKLMKLKVFLISNHGLILRRKMKNGAYFKLIAFCQADRQRVATFT